MIDDQSIVTYNGTWHGTFSLSADQVVKRALTKLTGMGLVTRNSSFDAGFTSTLGGPFTVHLVLQVENGLGFSSQDDIIADIRHTVYDVTGDFPTADSIPQVQYPGDRSPVDTGEPGPGAPSGPVECIAGSSNDTTGRFSLSCWAKNLTSAGLSSVGIVVLIGVAIFGIVLYYSGGARARAFAGARAAAA